MYARVESEVGKTPVIAVAVIGLRIVVDGTFENARPPTVGQAMLIGALVGLVEGLLVDGMLTSKSLSVGADDVAAAPRMWSPSLVAAIRSVTTGELSAGG